MTDKEFLKQFGLQLAVDVQEQDFDGAFFSGVSAFSGGLQPGSLSYHERKGYKAAEECFKLLAKRREQGLAEYRQLEFKFH